MWKTVVFGSYSGRVYEVDGMVKEVVEAALNTKWDRFEFPQRRRDLWVYGGHCGVGRSSSTELRKPGIGDVSNTPCVRVGVGGGR